MDLLSDLIQSIDWKSDYNTELKRIRTEISKALGIPRSQLVIGQDSDAERIYWKLWNLAREDRAVQRKLRIKEIADTKYRHLSNARANDLATLDYAKEIEAARSHAIYTPDNKTVYTASTVAKAEAAHKKNMSTYKNCKKGINNMLNLDYSHLAQIQVWYGDEDEPDKRD